MSKRFESVNKDFFSYIEDTRSGLLYCTANYNDMKDLANLLNKQAEQIAELEEQLKNAIVLPCIKKHTTYLDIDSGFVDVAWYVIFKQNGYADEIFTIKCRSEEDAIKELKALKGQSE